VTNIVNLDPQINNLNELVDLLGVHDKNIKLLGKLLKVNIYSNNQEILIDSEDETKINKLRKIFLIMIKLIRNNIVINERDIIYLFHTVDRIDNNEIISLFLSRKEIIKTFTGKPIYPKTINQKKYLEAIENNALIFGIGPAGTGKTYLAVLSALKASCQEILKRRLIHT
jgi:phosphate starvation-inducible PhoH-like protein